MPNPYQTNYFAAADLKTILHSKRANIYYLEHCRVLQKDGRVLYLTQREKEYCYYNIPIANTTSILLGTGTSITQAAVRLLAQAGVLLGFCGEGGTPLFAGNVLNGSRRKMNIVLRNTYKLGYHGGGTKTNVWKRQNYCSTADWQ